MFLKTYRVKSNSAIRGSDRRKLRSEIGNAFPSLSPEDLGELIPNKEEMSVMRLVTHSGENVTVYCLKGEPTFFEIEKRIFPTVYTVWRKPDIMLQFTTWPLVFEKLQGGADLMLPGVILPQEMGENSFGRFEKDTPCSINLKGNKAAVAVGVTAVSSRDLIEDGRRGKGVIVLHTYLDNLWAQGSKMNLPLINNIEDKTASELSGGLEEKSPLEEKNMNSDDTNSLLGTESEECKISCDGRVGTVKQELKDLKLVEDQLEATLIDSTEASGSCRDSCTGVKASAMAAVVCSSGTGIEDAASSDEILPETEETPQDMDDLLKDCFLCALLRIKKNDNLPLLTSAFHKNYILSSCPEGVSIDIKKSSYKKLSKFLQSMQQRDFITVKSKAGVDSICGVNWDHEKLKEFKAMQSPLRQCGLRANKSGGESSSTSQEGPKIEELFSVSGATLGVFCELGYKKGDIFTAAEVRSAITNYVKSNELVCANNKKLVVLDPTLDKALINKNESVDRLQWDELFSRVLGKMNDCHRITFPGKQAMIRKGKIEAVEIKIEQRMGNKKVTLVSNLEPFGVDPQEFAHTLQIRAASSTSVSQLPGKHKTPGMQVLIQGKHIPLVATALLDEYKIPRKYISGLELMKGGKKKK